MVKPTRLRFVLPDKGITLVAWWGERLMAAMIAATTTTIVIYTNVGVRLELTVITSFIVEASAVVYVGMLGLIAVHPTRAAHMFALPFGLMLYVSRMAAFVVLWAEDPMGVRFNNIVERMMLSSCVLVFHTWGIWADRRNLDHTISVQ